MIFVYVLEVNIILMKTDLPACSKAHIPSAMKFCFDKLEAAISIHTAFKPIQNPLSRNHVTKLAGSIRFDTHCI